MPDFRSQPTALTLRQLNQRIGRILSVPELMDVWVVAELADVRVKGGHCYMELVEKHPDTGSVLARLSGRIWATDFRRIHYEFLTATGRQLETGMNVMVRGAVSFHAAYGLAFTINGINAEFTMGDVERRRREILARLHKEGVLELNRSIEWPRVALRVAVISARGAAGYGDFINQLYNNSSRLRFTTRLFEASLQGENTASSIIAALDTVAARGDEWDCVVIIRGGGSSIDLLAYDNYDLANNIAQFPLPVVIGIGHERDVSVLDYVANMRVKTPTAAAEWLIAHNEEALEELRRMGGEMLQAVTDRISGCQARLSYMEGMIPVAPVAALDRARMKLSRFSVALSGISANRLAPSRARLGHMADSLALAADTLLKRRRDRLDAMETLLEALSPQATLRRGYSLTTIDGRTVRSVADVAEGAKVTTTVADGSFTSTVD